MKPLKLVLLPGLDGTTELFEPLRPWLSRKVEALTLPGAGRQDYSSLGEAMLERLSENAEPFVLLGESFSGPLAHRLALHAPPGLQGVIFAASFLHCPHPLLRWLAALPVPRQMLAHPLLLRAFCLDRGASEATLRLLTKVIRNIPADLLRARLETLSRLQPPTKKLSLPALQLLPTRDHLVSRGASASIHRHCANLQQQPIPGPHFLLQARPQACAEAIESFMTILESRMPDARAPASTSQGFL